MLGRARSQRREPLAQPKRVVAQDRVHAEHLVDDLRHAQVDDDRGERERVRPREAVLALHQVEHPVDRDPGSEPEVLVEAEA